MRQGIQVGVHSKVKRFVVRVGDLAEICSISGDTVRYYESLGLIRADRRPNGYRDFPRETVELIRLIRLAQSFGFSLSEIGALLRDMQGAMSEEDVSRLLQIKLEEIDARVDAMQKLRAVVAARLEAACPLGLGQAPAKG